MNQTDQTVKKVDWDELLRLRLEYPKEFRYQMISHLKAILLNQDLKTLGQFFRRFKKDLIQDSFFYVEVLNEILKDFLLKDKVGMGFLLYEFSFFVQIGDLLTLSLLKGSLRYFDSERSQDCQKQLELLENRIELYQEDLKGLKLYPMREILDEWMD